MPCNCKCCCGCCCDGSTGSQSLEPPCTAPKEFKGKGTICDVCCDLGEIREDITTEEECTGTWVVNGRCAGCTPPPCSGPCDEENPCSEGCTCVDGECVEQGFCCISCSPSEGYSTQAECEACTPVYDCYEQTFSEDPEATCPEGWTRNSSEFGTYCNRYTNPTSCEECAGYCSSYNIGPCGTWTTGSDPSKACNPRWCEEFCEVQGNSQLENYPLPNGGINQVSRVWFVNGFFNDPIPVTFQPYSTCRWIVFSTDTYVMQTTCDGVTVSCLKLSKKAFEVDCESGALIDVTDEILIGTTEYNSGCSSILQQCGIPEPSFFPPLTLSCGPFP